MRSGREPGQPHAAHIPHLALEDIGESPVWPTLAVLSAAALYATLPDSFVAGAPGAGLFELARWAVPIATVLLLVPLVLSLPQQRLLRSASQRATALRLSRRIAALGVIALISVANAAAIALLVHLLLAGAAIDPAPLLRAGVHMWCMNVLVFALWFWQLDGGGPMARHLRPDGDPDFLFPQQSLDGMPRAWAPTFLDYLYLAYTNATAFSPTDAMPLSHWAKVLMMLQSAASLALAIMVVARAVNILH
jgi:uncharacterized membrane protein